MLSLCMIVKNEEDNLKSCLSQLVNFVDEIIIVDTGSNDSTKAIASKFTDKIYDFKWCSDFSKARNFFFFIASYDWILVFDAVVFSVDFNRDNVNKFINDFSRKNKAGRIKRINIMEDSNENKKYIERVNRLFNRKYFHYEGIIHEQIVALNGKTYGTEKVDIIADHVGYTKEVLNRTDKIKRNIELLDAAVKNNSEDPYLYF